MGLTKESIRTNLFAGVFGIICLMITGLFGYIFTAEVVNAVTFAMIITMIFTMWMVYFGAFVSLAIVKEK